MDMTNNTSMIFDTETNGLFPKISFTPNWNEIDISTFPYIIQLSYVIIDENTNNILTISDAYIKIPRDIIISDFVSSINGITNKQLDRHGVDLIIEMEKFMKYYIESKKIIGHNLSFDMNMILVSIIRIIEEYKDVDDKIDEYNKWINYYNIAYFKWRECGLCTMRTNTKLCNIWVKKTNSEGVYLKFPKLSELHEKLFSSSVYQLHNSLIDVFVCLRCYYFNTHNIDLVKSNKVFKQLYLLIQ